MSRSTSVASTLRLAPLSCLLALAACSSAPLEPRLGEEESFDGLRRVTNSRMAQAWIRPDLDLSGYTSVVPVYPTTQFAPARATSAGSASGLGSPPFPILPRDRERIHALVQEVFGAALQKSERFTIATALGPEVLLVVVGLLDVESNVPPEPIGRGEVYLSSVGAATLWVELRDSGSNAVLARFFDRRTASSPGVASAAFTPATVSAVRRMLASWAELLRRRLDEIPTPTDAGP